MRRPRRSSPRRGSRDGPCSTEVESKQILAAYGIPTVETRVATTEDEAVAAAEAIGFPVVLKLHSETITHKTDVGGVQLNLTGAEAVRRAYRAIESAVGRARRCRSISRGSPCSRWSRSTATS